MCKVTALISMGLTKAWLLWVLWVPQSQAPVPAAQPQAHPCAAVAAAPVTQTASAQTQPCVTAPAATPNQAQAATRPCAAAPATVPPRSGWGDSLKRHLADMAQKEEQKVAGKVSKGTGGVIDGSDLPTPTDFPGGEAKQATPCVIPPASAKPAQPGAAPMAPAVTTQH